jgi:hypothetical protein
MKSMICAAAAAAAAFGLAWGQNSFASGGLTIEETAAALAAEGLPVEIADGAEAGKIYSEVNGGNFEVLSANCGAGGRCTEFLFIAGFDLPDGFPLDRVNAWNADQLAGRAFLDEENDPFLDHVVSVSGEQDEGALREAIYLWAAALEAFMDYIDLPMADA